MTSRRQHIGAELARYVGETRGVELPADLVQLLDAPLPPEIDHLVYWPTGTPNLPPSIEWADELIASSQWPLPRDLVPILPVDEASFACVVAAEIGSDGTSVDGTVVRWHLAAQKDEHQAAVLDVDGRLYVESVGREYAWRDEGLHRMLDQIGPAYEIQYLEAEKRPRDFVIRPVRIACQNVIVALGAFAHDSSIDGMSVVAWQTCEVPHVAAHEGNRALAALMLCDAFQSGGTMEIRFDRPARLVAKGTTAKTGSLVDVDVVYDGHPEGGVPASLRRYGRTVDVLLGYDAVRGDPGAISPGQARDLFMAVTPMPDDLRRRVREACEANVASPERLCFTLLAQIWREVELDFMLACSPRTGSIITGGVDWSHRGARQAESEVARLALMIGMLYRRLDMRDDAGAMRTQATVIEDNRVGVSWEVLPDVGAITFRGLRGEELPWQQELPRSERQSVEQGQSLTVVPRLQVDDDALAITRDLSRDGRPTAIVIPRGDGNADGTAGILVLRCPDRIGELDQVIETKLLKSRMTRA